MRTNARSAQMKFNGQNCGKPVFRGFLAVIAGVLVAVAPGTVAQAAGLIDDFNSYTGGSDLVGQGGWVGPVNWYGGFGSDSPIVAGGGGIGGGGNNAAGVGDAAGFWMAAIAVDPADVADNGDYQFEVKLFTGGSVHRPRLVLGNDGLVNGLVPLHGNRIFFDTGDLTYQSGENGDTGNPGMTFPGFTDWAQARITVHAVAGTLDVEWRDLHDTTGAPLGAYSLLGTVTQTYGTPSFIGFFISGDAGARFDDFEALTSPTPEPTTTSLLVVALITVGLDRTLRRKTAKL